MDIFTEFGIQPILLGAQILNFLVLLLLLNIFLYKPVVRALEQRRHKIAASLKQAAEIEQNLIQTEADREKKLIKASDEARQIIEEARESAAQILTEAQAKTQSDIQQLLDKSKQEIASERAQMQQQLKAEFADLVAASLEQIAHKKLSPADKQQLSKQALSQL